MAVTAAVVTITPAQAQALLEANTTNRKVSRSRVEQYATDMAAGNWLLNGEAIVQNDNGTLSNGQHRLLACVKAGVPFQTLIVRGVQADSMLTIDTGSSRTLADYLAIKGNPNASILASAVVWAMRYDGMIERDLNQPVPGRFSRSEQIEYLSRAPALLEHSMDVTIAAKKLLPGRPGIFGFVHFIASRDCGASQRKIDDFITYSCDPAGLRESEAPRLLRAALLSMQSKSTHMRPSATIEAALVAKAMAYWTTEREGRILKWSRGRGRQGSKAHKETFPRIAA